MASNQRTARSNVPREPSSRPFPSQARRPATLGASSIAAKPALKSRPSLGSITDRREGRQDGMQDTAKTAMNGSAKRVSASGPPRSISPTKASLGRRSVLVSAANVDKKSATNRSSTASALKPALKNTESTVRPSKPSVTPRSTRPIGYSPYSSPATKKPSSITASPNLIRDAGSWPASPKPEQTPTEAKAPRPQLLARKSTMSVTIEQRLREMELVNIMLRAAMAEDDTEEDEVKEEYGKQADEQLADLRAKLEEARRNEGKIAPKDSAPSSHEDAAKDNQSFSSAAAFEARLAESQQETLMVRAELSSLREQLAAKNQSISDDNRENAVTEASNNHHKDPVSELEEVRVAHNQELAALQQSVEEAKGKLCENLAKHAKELEEAKRMAAAEGSQRATRLLDNQLQHHDAELGAIRKDLTKERLSKQEAAAKAERLGYDLLDLRNKHDEARAEMEALQKELTAERLARIDANAKAEQSGHGLLAQQHKHEEERAQYLKSLKELEQRNTELSSEIETVISTKDAAYNQLMNESHSLQVRKDQQNAASTNTQTAAFTSQLREYMMRIQNLNAAATAQAREFELRISTLVHRIQELEAKVTEMTADRDTVDQKKSGEIANLQAVIEALQDRVRDIHEAKDRELDSRIFQLSQQHDEIVSKLELKHKEAVWALVQKHSQGFASLREESKKKAKAADAKAQQQIQDQQQALERSETQQAEAKVALTEAKELLEALTAELEKIRIEREQVKADNEAFEDCLERSHQEREILTRKLESIEEEQRTAKQEHSASLSKLQEQINAAIKARDAKDLELRAAKDSHAAAMLELESEQRRRVADLEKGNENLANISARAHEDKIAALRLLHAQELDAGKRELATAKREFATKLKAAKEAVEGAKIRQMVENSNTYKRMMGVEADRDMRLRRADTALKEVKAELAELQTKLANSSPPVAATPPRVSDPHRSSLGVKDENSAGKNENLGPSILGNMAGMKEQVKQITQVNEDLWLVQDQLLSNVSSLDAPKPLRWLDSTTKDDKEEE